MLPVFESHRTTRSREFCEIGAFAGDAPCAGRPGRHEGLLQEIPSRDPVVAVVVVVVVVVAVVVVVDELRN
jgi:hypothetical protein